ncbi:asparagine synthase (glutamine-hydrolyzing) [Sphingomonas zeicaulis]|uniref:asparagine synthase-related protein n=1 Tax=Sphingomonas zeicaulis TaxID=1632740 RepID=UPI003D22366D
MTTTDQPELALFADPRLQCHEHDGWFALGRVFGPSPRQRQRMAPNVSHVDQATMFAQAHWGDYVRLRASGQNAIVQRAAMTGMPVYWTWLDGALLIFSDLSLALTAGLFRPSVDWDFVVQRLTVQDLRTCQTGLSGVSELLPGEALLFGNRAIEARQLWSPWPFVEDQAQIEDRLAAAAAVRRATIEVMSAWASESGRILLELSGGLDSSIVAVALAACGADFACISVASEAADGDERRYAQAVARQIGAHLHEAIALTSSIDLTRAPSTITPRPPANRVLSAFDAHIRRTLTENGYSRFFSGIGGDNVFASSNSTAPLRDALRRFGPGRHALATLTDVATLNGTTIARVARTAWTAARRAAPPGWTPADRFTSRDVASHDLVRHPWLDRPPRLSSGKRQHVDALLRISDFLDRPDRLSEAEQIAPLLSQPLVEVCLRIPSWLWVAGGRDRAVARDAFADLLPPLIVQRRTKGRLEAMCAGAYLAQRKQLAPILLDGWLARAGMIDTRAIEAYLARPLHAGDFDYFRLLELVDLELWIGSVESWR